MKDPPAVLRLAGARVDNQTLRVVCEYTAPNSLTASRHSFRLECSYVEDATEQNPSELGSRKLQCDAHQPEASSGFRWWRMILSLMIFSGLLVATQLLISFRSPVESARYLQPDHVARSLTKRGHARSRGPRHIAKPKAHFSLRYSSRQHKLSNGDPHSRMSDQRAKLRTKAAVPIASSSSIIQRVNSLSAEVLKDLIARFISHLLV
jgi:hypothetical protein